MRNVLKATTLENRFPLLAVEEGCILSKDADITVAFRVDLPELYTVTSAEYAAIHCKRLRDSILSPFFHSYIFAMYKNEALWI